MRIIKAQSALEYLMIVALTLGIIIPTTYIFLGYTSESGTQIVDSQINQIGREIIDTAETVYFSGRDSKIILEFNMPKSVVNIKIKENRELVFYLTTEIGDTEMVFFSSVDVPITNIATADGGCPPDINGIITCDLSDIATEGAQKIKIQSIDDDSGTGTTEIHISRVA